MVRSTYCTDVSYFPYSFVRSRDFTSFYYIPTYLLIYLRPGIGIFTSGIYLGGGLASLSIILDGKVGWRNTLLTIGAFGAVAVLGCLVFVKEPRYMQPTETEAALYTDVEGKKGIPVGTPQLTIDRAIGNTKAVFSLEEARYIFAAATLRYAAGFSIGVWKAPFVFEKFPGSENLFASSNAAVVAFGGLLSSVVGGYISDVLANPKPDKKAVARTWVPAVGSILAVPAWILFIRAPTPELSLAFLLCEYLVAECWFGPTLAALFTVVPDDKRGTAQGIFSVLTALGNFAPILIGALVGGSLGDFRVGDVLMYFVGGAYFISGLLFSKVAMLDGQRMVQVEEGI